MKILIVGDSKAKVGQIEVAASCGDWLEFVPGMADRQDIDLSQYTVTRAMVTWEGGLKIFVVRNAMRKCADCGEPISNDQTLCNCNVSGDMGGGD